MPAIDVQRAKEQYLRYRNTFPDPVSGGGMSEMSVAVWAFLLEWQRGVGIKGDMLEIGVWYGHGGALLAQHRADDERIVLVDKFMPQSMSEENLKATSPLKDSDVLFYNDCSLRLNRQQALVGHRDTVRFVHIDGEHSFEAVVNDLDLCVPLLVEHGIVAVDDFFMFASPNVTEAVFYWLERNREKLVMFLCGFNKAYLCSARMLPKLLPLIYELPFLFQEVGLQATLCTSGWANERPYFGLHWYMGKTHQRIGRLLEKPTFKKMMLGVA
jgi:predicted O-methyltransferase YrrM